MAALPNIGVVCEADIFDAVDEKMKTPLFQDVLSNTYSVQGRRIRNLAVMVTKRRSQSHLFYFFDLQRRFQITRVQSC